MPGLRGYPIAALALNEVPRPPFRLTGGEDSRLRECTLRFFNGHVTLLQSDSWGAECGLKQIGRRTKISGAQWKIENISQVIAHCCAYLNGLIFAR